MPDQFVQQKAFASAGVTFDFLHIPVVWRCLSFLLCATVLSIVQSFAPEAVRQLYAVPPAQLVAICLIVYMVCSKTGPTDPSQRARQALDAWQSEWSRLRRRLLRPGCRPRDCAAELRPDDGTAASGSALL